MDYGISALFIALAYFLGWIWGEEVKGYFERRKMSKGLHERLKKLQGGE